jgi:hypothetical protein
VLFIFKKYPIKFSLIEYFYYLFVCELTICLGKFNFP